MELMERMLRLACAQNRGKVVCGNRTERLTNCGICDSPVLSRQAAHLGDCGRESEQGGERRAERAGARRDEGENKNDGTTRNLRHGHV